MVVVVVVVVVVVGRGIGREGGGEGGGREGGGRGEGGEGRGGEGGGREEEEGVMGKGGRRETKVLIQPLATKHLPGSKHLKNKIVEGLHRIKSPLVKAMQIRWQPILPRVKNKNGLHGPLPIKQLPNEAARPASATSQP